MHLLHCLRLSDPLLRPLRARLPDIPWLPFYYPFGFPRLIRCAYLLEPGDRIRVFDFGLKDRFDPGDPYEDYPASFRKRPVRLERLDYEEQKTLLLADQFESGGRSVRRFSAADWRLLRHWKFPFTQIGGFLRLTQGEPITPCPNRACPDFQQNVCMRPIASVWNRPVPRVSLWGKWGADVQIVYEQCRSCGTICVSNQCD